MSHTKQKNQQSDLIKKSQPQLKNDEENAGKMCASVIRVLSFSRSLLSRPYNHGDVPKRIEIATISRKNHIMVSLTQERTVE